MHKKILHRYMSGKKNSSSRGLRKKKFLPKLNHPYPLPPGEETGEFDTLVDFIRHRVVVLHFKIENTPIKDTSGKRKFKRVFRFLFVDKRELFAMKLSFEEFNLICFLHGGSERLACFEPTEAARFLKKLEVHSVLYGHRKYVFKRKFLCLERFHGVRRFLHFDIGVKEKPQNVHLKLIFCHVLS